MPLPLYITPWWLVVFLGYPKWRFKNKKDLSWEYLPNSEYRRIFGRKPPYWSVYRMVRKAGS
jgi:hypothetical protein